MIVRRAAEARGHSRFDWLDSRHTFSFGAYYDPGHMGFRALRVINDDRVKAGAGFGRHPHRDMEIFSYVLDGALAHQASLGTGSTVRAGEVQKMSAGTGISHSEFNPSTSDPVRFLQIWIAPERPGLPPSYEEKRLDEAAKRNRLALVGSRDGRDASITFHQDVEIFAACLDPGVAIEYRLAPGRGAWLHVARGAVSLNGTHLDDGDGASIENERVLSIRGERDAEVLLLDLA